MTHSIIFTDLDGTLLDAASYSFADAQPALNLVDEQQVPLILCSSKTRAEIELLRAQLHNSHPFIAENGGGIYVPPAYFSFNFNSIESNTYDLIRLGVPYGEIRREFVRLRERHRVKVRGFGDMSSAEIVALTGLDEAGAQRAKQRDFDEAFVFEDEPDADFLRAIEAAGLNWTQGRLFHLMGNHDKGRAVNMLISLYRQEYGEISSIALGDSLNDLPMLACVEQAVLVRHPDGTFDARINLPNLTITQHPGPAGWNESVLQLLAKAGDGNPPLTPAKNNLMAIFNAALAAVDPYNAVLNSARVDHLKLYLDGTNYDLSVFNRIIVIGAGKATARMALAVESLLGDKIDSGLIVVKDGHSAPLSVIEQVESSHPVPGEAGVAGTRRILEMVQAADEDTLIICLISGGASALLVAPADTLTLQDKQSTTRLLLNAGASINELNAVRKHLSSVKGGRLAQAAYPAQMLTLIVSDVIGDPLDVIASGPTAADGSTFADAWEVIHRYGLSEKIPSGVADYLQRGVAGREQETVKENDPCLSKLHNAIIASIRQALAAAQEKSLQLGYAVKIVTDQLQGEAREMARFLAQVARDELSLMKPHEKRCLLFGGETTVAVKGNGVGGRNQEMALAFALEIAGLQGVAMLSAGTDGTDGPCDAAGALVDGNTAALAAGLGIDPKPYLDNNDSYHFFEKLDAASKGQRHIKTGPTGTNVMDIQIVLLHKPG